MELSHERFLVAINFEIEKITYNWTADETDRKDFRRFLFVVHSK
jgi:hypothetical protein